MAATSWTGKRDEADGKAAYEKREKRRTVRKLQEAIDARDTATVKDILQKDFDVDFRYRGQTALQLAVRLGALDICKLLMERSPNVDEADGELNSILNSACWNGYEDVAKLLIDNGANVEFENEAGSTPLHACAKKGHAKIARLLVAGNCSLNVGDRLGRTATMVAAQSGQGEVVEVLAKAGADLDWMDQQNKTPLIVAAQQGFLNIVTTLVKAGANCNLQDRSGHTALLEATMNSHVNVVEVLLQHKADPDRPATKGTTPLLEAIRNNNVEIAQLLLEAGCDINKCDRLHHAPIHDAIRQVVQYFDPVESGEVVNLVKRLVRAGADLNVGDNQGWRPLYQAAYGRHLELTELLLKNGVDLSVSTVNNDSILHAAVYGNNLDIINMLIKAGCSVNEVNKMGQNPLLAGIVSRSDIQILTVLVAAGTDLNQPEISDGFTPLHEAIHQHYNEAAILLIDSGCDLTAQTKERKSPLCMASQKGNEVITSHILATLPRPLVFTTLSAIPLHTAAKYGHADIIRLLVQGGCNINQLNIEGLTALQVAATEDNYAAARRLLQLGCDPDAHAKITTLQKCCIQNEDPHPHLALEPLFLAMTHRNFDLMRILLQCYPTTPFRVLKLLRTILRTTQELTTHYSPDMKKELLTIFHDSLSKPKSLQDVCRRRIRQCLGWPLLTKVESLPMLPVKLKDYVAMVEVFQGLDEEDHLQEELLGRPSGFGWRGSTLH